MVVKNGGGVKSPLQMVTYFFASVEAAMVASLWAINDGDHAFLTVLIWLFVVANVAFGTLIISMLIYLIRKHPFLIFNMPDYSAEAQLKVHEHVIVIESPPVVPTPDITGQPLSISTPDQP